MARSTTRKRKRSYVHPSRKSSKHTSGKRNRSRRYKRKRSQSKRTRAVGWPFSREKKFDGYNIKEQMTETLTLNTKTGRESYNIWFDVMQDKKTKKNYLPLEFGEEFGSKKMIKLETFEDPKDSDLMSVVNPVMKMQGSTTTLSIEVSETDKTKLKTLIKKTKRKAKEYIKTANKIQQKIRDSTSHETDWPKAKNYTKVKTGKRMSPRQRSVSHAPTIPKKK